MRKYLALILLTIYFAQGQAQEILYSSNEDLGGDSIRIEIGVFDLTDCALKELYTDTTKYLNSYVEWVDIALCPDGILYGLGSDGIYTIDLVNKEHTRILEILGPGIRWKKGLTCTGDTVLIFGERDIFSYDIKSQMLLNHGKVPGSMSIWANLFWLNNSLFGSLSDQIVMIDLENPSGSQIYCDLPEQGFLSFTEVAISCDSVAIFGFHISGDIYIVDATNCSITYHCTLPHSLMESFQGSSPVLTFISPAPCKIEIDLDSQDLTAPGLDSRDTIFCELPNKFLLSTLNLFSDKPWDSINVWIENDPVGIYLKSDVYPSIATVNGNHTKRLSIVSNSAANLSEFSSYLNDLNLGGVMSEGYSDLKIGFCGWMNMLVSDTAYAFVTLVSRTSSAGEDSIASICTSNLPFYVPSLVSSDFTPGGTWKPELNGTSTINPQIDSVWEFMYIVQDPWCFADTAKFVIQTLPEPLNDFEDVELMCPGDTIHLNTNWENVNILWSNGSTNNAIDIFVPQNVWIDYIDTFDCYYSDTILILLDDECLVKNLYIPNIFSPDGNGANDEWGIAAQPGIQIVEVSIFDRWGSILYQEQGQSIFWNGYSSGGNIVASGTYIYLIKIKTLNNKALLRSGNLTLIR